MTVKTDVHICGFCFDSKYSVNEVVKFSKDKYDIDLSGCEFCVHEGFVSDMYKRIFVREGQDVACKFIEVFEQKFNGKIYIIHTVRRHVKDCPKNCLDNLKDWQAWHHWVYDIRVFARKIENRVLGYGKNRDEKCRS